MAKKQTAVTAIEEQAVKIVDQLWSGEKEGKEYRQALAYVTYWLPHMTDKTEADVLGLTLDEYISYSMENALNDGLHLQMEVDEPEEEFVIETPEEQEIEEVDQNAVKKALKALITSKGDKVAKKLELYYTEFDRANKAYFDGQLSHPLITIDKMNNRTLGNYTEGEDAMSIENHIRLNQNFVALNPDERVLETLVHEMIHQWQDEVLYLPSKHKGKPGKVNYPVTEKAGKDKYGKETYKFTGEWKEIDQKKRPKDWHNRDFKDMASVVGIPALGDKCYGNKAKMPEPKSYNRKFICGCVASNGYPLTVWSTRMIHATCDVCKKKYKEVPKGGKVIKVTQSHVEKPGEDAIANELKGKYANFRRFVTKADMEDFVEVSKDTKSAVRFIGYETGVYQKHHNSYKDGYCYWVAYNTEGNNVSKEKPKEKEKSKSKPKGRTLVKSPKKKPKTGKLDYKNPEDLIVLYRELGSMKAVAEKLGVTTSALTYQKKKFNIDFGKGVYEDAGEKVSVD